MKKIKYKYFILYLSYLVIILLIFIPLYVNLFSSLEEKTSKTFDVILESGIKELEDEFQKVILSSDILYSNNTVKKVLSIKPPIRKDDVVEIRSMRTYYSSAMRLIDKPCSMGLINKNKTVLSNGYIYLDNNFFYNQYFSLNEYNNFDEWYRSIVDIDQYYAFIPTLASVNNDIIKEYILFIIALPLNTQISETFFYAAYDQEIFLNALIPAELNKNCEIIVTNANGMEIIHKNPMLPNDYNSIRKESEIFGISVEIHIPQSIGYEQILYMKNTLFILISIYVMVGAILAIIYTLYNTKPISKLTTQAIKIHNSIEDNQYENVSQNKDALTYIDDFLVHVDTKLKESKYEISKQNALIRDNLFEKLLNGYDFNDNDIIEIKQNYLQDLPDVMRIIILRINNYITMPYIESSSVKTKISKLVLNSFPSCYVQFISTFLVLFLDAEKNINDIKLVDETKRLIQILGMEISINVTTIISDEIQSLKKLNTVFTRLSHILHMIPEYDNALYFQKNFTKHDITSGYSWHKIVEFSQLLCHAKKNEALSLLKMELDQLVINGYANESELAQLFFCYRHAISTVIYNSTTLMKYKMNIALPDYKYSANIDSIFIPLFNCISEICDIIIKDPVPKQNLIEQITIYVDKNIVNPNLFASTIAEQFNISESTVYRLFRNEHGKSLGVYIEQKRMECARHFLENNNLSVKEIANNCGYTNINTFYKIFKRFYKVAPSSFIKGIINI